jgi:hypothetical protein
MLLAIAPTAAPSLVVSGDDPSVFAALSRDEVAAAVWTRPNPCTEEGYPAYAEPTREEWRGLPPWLEADLELLSGLVRIAAGVVDVRVRLETAIERTCPRFHQDAVRLRLLTTYRGPGVEWTCASGEGPIGQAGTGAVVLMKGRSWPSRARPLLHRSPKASRARPRWVLAIDPVEPPRAPG